LKKTGFERFNDRRLIFDLLGREDIVKIFNQVNNELREIDKGCSASVGTIKLLHTFAPYYKPLIDGYIAETVGLIHIRGRRRRESLTSDSYFKGMNVLKTWLLRYPDIVEKLNWE
jgi:hypothetical protein